MLYQVSEIYYNRGPELKDVTATYEKEFETELEVLLFKDEINKHKSPNDLVVHPILEGVSP